MGFVSGAALARTARLGGASCGRARLGGRVRAGAGGDLPAHLERLLAAIDTEMRNNYVNVAGARERFAEYLARELGRCAGGLSHRQRSEKVEPLVEVLRAEYPRMSPATRRQLLHERVTPLVNSVVSRRRSAVNQTTPGTYEGKARADREAFQFEKEVFRGTMPTRVYSGQGYGSVGLRPSAMSGETPNALWNAVSKWELRSHPAFTPLPMQSEVELDDLEDLQQLRQDSVYWEEAKRNIQVSASRWWEVLGFAEDAAGKFFKTRRQSGLRDHNRAVEAWKRASDPHSYQEPPVEDRQRVLMDWGRNHEANGLVALMDAHGVTVAGQKLVRVFETGLWVLTEERFEDLLPKLGSAVDFDDLPVMAASPDARLQRRDNSGLWSAFETVEVKTKCPFVYIGRKNGHGRGRAGWLLKQFEPHKQVTFLQYAQIQLQLACTGATTGHLVSHVASGATTVFEVPINYEWLAVAFRLTARFNCDFVYPGVEPQVDFFNDSSEYQEFLKLTSDSCAAAQGWLSIPAGARRQIVVTPSPHNPFVPSYRM